MDYNKLQAAGRLTKDVELKTAGDGTVIGKFNVATNKTWKNKAGEKQTKACFIPFTAFGDVAKNCAKYLRSGSPVFIDGYLDLNQWKDGKTGEPKQRMNYIAERVYFLEGKSASEQRQAQAVKEARHEPDEGLDDDNGQGGDAPPFPE